VNTYTWYAQNLELANPEVIHNILMYGSLEDIIKLRKDLGAATVDDAFINHPKKIYSKPAYYFIKHYIIKSDIELDESKYLKTAPRTLG